MNINLSLLERAERGESLSAAEMAELDAMLEASSPVARAVQVIPIDEPSMVWRSELNEKLRAMAPAPRSTRFGWRWFAPAAVAGVALAGFMIFSRPAPVSADKLVAAATIESTMISAHSENDTLADVSAVSYPVPTESAPSDVMQWTPDDLESL